MALDINDYNPAFRYGAEAQTDDIKAENVTRVKIGATAIEGSQIATGRGFFSVGVLYIEATDATKNVFGAGGLGVAASITGFYASPMDATFSTNVGLETTSNSIGTVIMTGTAATTESRLDAELANTTLAAGTQLLLRKDTEGSVQVLLTFEID